jgi:hypothetical protein
LSYNDPQAGAGTGEGEPRDRNVELLLEDPRKDPPDCQKKPVRDPEPTDEGPGGESAGSASPQGSLPFTGLTIGALLIVAAGLLLTGQFTGWLARRTGRS